MDKRGELNNRWHRIFERSESVDQQEALSKIPDHQIINDVRFLVAELKSMEERLSAAQNPFSSQVGQTVLWKDGDLLYMLRGTYVPVEDIVKGIVLLKELYTNLINPRKEQSEVVKKLDAVISDVIPKVNEAYNDKDTKKKPKTDTTSS